METFNLTKELNFGIVGLSEGNGHPYSWSAIFNGYNKKYMRNCPFPVIPKYLYKQNFPQDCIANAKVTHIWTQDKKISKHIAKSSNIENIVDNLGDMLGKIDALLLARDDAKNHYKMAKPFIDSGIPVYIDKPLATTLKEANKIYALEKYNGQIFTCSAMAYAPELLKVPSIGQIKFIEAQISKDWDKYSIHIIEPVLKLIKDKHIKNTNICFKTLGDLKCEPKISLYGTNGFYDIVFKDTFNAFKNALLEFTQIVNGKKKNNSKAITLEAIKIIERGNNA